MYEFLLEHCPKFLAILLSTVKIEITRSTLDNPECFMIIVWSSVSNVESIVFVRRGKYSPLNPHNYLNVHLLEMLDERV